MPRKLLLEITVEDLPAAEAAERGGADRIELCAELPAGGVTPPDSLIRAVRQAVRVPVFSMIRPRAGNFVYSAAEFDDMKAQTARARSLGMDGVVFGILDAAGGVDVPRTRDLVGLAGPLPVTFHRAFDETMDLALALEQAVAAGARRILTSGGRRSAAEGLDSIADLVRRAGERILIVPGGGIQAKNLERVVRETGAREFHSGLSTLVPYPRSAYREFEAGVSELAKTLRELGA